MVDPAFTPLFDVTQQSFSKWRFTNGRNVQGRDYFVIGNIIELNTQPGQLALFYYTGDTYQNFELRLEWKAFSTELNSGVFLRMPVEPPADLIGNDPYYKQCIEVQIDESGKDFDASRVPQAIYGSSRYKTGAVYGIAPATTWAAKVPGKDGTDGTWNAYRITANNNNLEVELNRVKVCDANTNIINPGYIGLQLHSGKIQFRNIQIKEL